MPVLYYTLITGASEGLGKYLALECAGRGRHLLLVALPGSGLQKLAGYIRERYSVQVVCLEKDLSTEKSCVELCSEIKDRNVRINCLVNNAGIGGSYGFDEKHIHFYARQIAVNVTAPTLLSRLLLPDLRRHAPAEILNVSSMAGFFALPNKQVYAATKSYLFSFSRSLRRELKEDGITVSVLCPGGINTRWQLMIEHRLHRSAFCRVSVLHPAAVAAIAMDGLQQHKGVIIPGFWNKLFFAWSKICPGWLQHHLTRHQLKKLKPIPGPLTGEAGLTSSIAV